VQGRDAWPLSSSSPPSGCQSFVKRLHGIDIKKRTAEADPDASAECFILHHSGNVVVVCVCHSRTEGNKQCCSSEPCSLETFSAMLPVSHNHFVQAFSGSIGFISVQKHTTRTMCMRLPRVWIRRREGGQQTEHDKVSVMLVSLFVQMRGSISFFPPLMQLCNVWPCAAL
jgi:hypothetical protein